MNINDQFPSKYLKASDIEGETPAVISEVTMEDIGSEDRKPVLYFKNMEKGIVLNKTNANNITAAYGPETDGWNGKPIVIYTAWVDFAGKSTEAIRIRPDNKRAPARSAGEPQMTNAPPRGAGSSTPPQFSDPADPGFYPDDLR